MEATPLAEFVESKLLSTAIHNQQIRHGFFKRRGGISGGIFSDLNAGLGSGDITDHVAENRRRICKAINVSPSKLATVHQHHSNQVFVATDGIKGDRPKADGIVTNSPSVAIGVVTADCGPVLFADPKNKVIGAAHAGWQGALNGVLENTIATMETLGAERSAILACLGPTISQENYEVGPEFLARFTEEKEEFSTFFIPSKKPGHYLFDLHEFIMVKLATAGVQNENLGICTYANEDDYFSYRRTTHRSEKDYGRQLSVITME